MQLLFEDEWEKVKLPEGQTFVGLAIKMANDEPKGFDLGPYGHFLNVAYHLQQVVGGPFALPTSEKTADQLGMSGRAISTYIKRASAQGYLKPHSVKWQIGVMARTFRFEVPN